MELVSVIIPVYNVKPYLSEAIESVINQTYQDLEIIFVVGWIGMTFMPQQLIFSTRRI